SLAYATLEGAGSDTFRSGASLVVWGDDTTLKRAAKVDHVTVKGSGGVGVLLEHVAGFTADSTDLTVTGSGSWPIRTTLRGAVTLPNATLTGNAIDRVSLVGDGLSENGTLRDFG